MVLTVLKKISIESKFLFIGLLLIAHFLYHIFFNKIPYWNEVDKKFNETREGLTYVKMINSQVTILQKVRGLTNIYLSGDKSVEKDINELKRKLKREFDTIEKFHKVYFSIEAQVTIDEIIKDAKRLNEAAPHMSANEAYESYSELIENILSFVIVTANNFNIRSNVTGVDYVLADILIEKLPQNIENLGKLRAIASGVAAKDMIKEAEFTKIDFLLRLYKLNKKSISANLSKSFDIDLALREQLLPFIKPATLAEEKFMKILQNEIIEVNIKTKPKVVFDVATEVIQKNLDLYLKTFDILQNRIENSRQEEKKKVLMDIFLDISMMISIAVIFFLFYKSAIGFIRKIENVEKAKSQFLSNMSHEIRTPLNAILGFIDILRKKEKDKEALKYIEIIRNSSATLLGIINDILDFSKIESGKMSIELIKCDPYKKLQSILDLFLLKAKEKNIKLEIFFDSKLPRCIVCDPLRIRQVISNLLFNAIKFTPENGMINLDIKYDTRQKNITFSVKDNGIGISKESQKKIFEAFVQAENSTTRKFGGTGLGLSISSKLVSLMGGELKLESEYKKGSRFYFTLQLNECKSYDAIYDEKVLSGQKIKKIKQTDSKKLHNRVLLVEDNEANRMYMGIVLKKMGLEYEFAYDGLEAIEAFKSKQFDVVLMDENMPNMGGIEAAKEMLKFEKEQNLEHTPIIALTANNINGDRERFLAAGMDEYLSKPVRKREIREILNRFLVK